LRGTAHVELRPTRNEILPSTGDAHGQGDGEVHREFGYYGGGAERRDRTKTNKLILFLCRDNVRSLKDKRQSPFETFYRFHDRCERQE